jgi:hypothetical protein
MGQATRTTKLLLDLGKREEGGANSGKRAYLEATGAILNQARAFYLDFFLAHAEKLDERVSYYSEKHLEMRTRAISPNELLTWAEAHTVKTCDHPHPAERNRGDQECLGQPTTPRSTTGRSSWTSPAAERSTRGLCASKSIRARADNGTTIPSSTAAIFSNA